MVKPEQRQDYIEYRQNDCCYLKSEKDVESDPRMNALAHNV